MACPLPPDTAACRALSETLAARLLPWLAPAEAAHVRAFRRPQPACGHWLARAALAMMLAARGERPESLLPRLSRLPGGAPLLPGWAVAFSYSEEAAFVALQPADGLRLPIGLDAEACASPPPHASAFSERERRPRGGLTARERLRRWVIKESLLKAAGTGLTRDPATVDSGRHGQRCGRLEWGGTAWFWHCLPLPGHWLALTASRPVRLRSGILPPWTLVPR